MYDIFKPVKTYKILGFRTSEVEIKDLIKAWVAISLAFGIVLYRQGMIPYGFFPSMLLAGLTVGIGFLFHEMGHKLVAQRYRCWAEFRAFDMGLILAIAMSFFGFVFAAPGAVMISGHVNVKRNGKISLAGPLTNLILAAIFTVVGLFFVSGFIERLAFFGVMINSWLALFNMIPIWRLDGKKILMWNRGAYFSVIIVALLFLFL